MSYVEQMQRVANEYFEAGHTVTTTHEIAIWAVETGRWSPPRNSDYPMRRRIVEGNARGIFHRPTGPSGKG